MALRKRLWAWLVDLVRDPDDVPAGELQDLLHTRQRMHYFPTGSHIKAYEWQHPGQDVLYLKTRTHDIEIIIDEDGGWTRVGIYADRNEIWGSEEPIVLTSFGPAGNILRSISQREAPRIAER